MKTVSPTTTKDIIAKRKESGPTTSKRVYLCMTQIPRQLLLVVLASLSVLRGMHSRRFVSLRITIHRNWKTERAAREVRFRRAGDTRSTMPLKFASFQLAQNISEVLRSGTETSWCLISCQVSVVVVRSKHGICRAGVTQSPTAQRDLSRLCNHITSTTAMAPLYDPDSQLLSVEVTTARGPNGGSRFMAALQHQYASILTQKMTVSFQLSSWEIGQFVFHDSVILTCSDCRFHVIVRDDRKRRSSVLLFFCGLCLPIVLERER